ncbi:DUF6455 family protein [Thalassobius sp. Cn5-15]|jgi:hypothetical protein|uniref:DUF6455 family protein n=1 Tax=Thalassobius sp. Cn5-15 TaxID=2917763 RepID=UPI001EF25107|nr:DUF6455 family protein [Thalassobius sp. Cn5-15]MCG7493734.1 DUF6455 family protein [Thalassobius sp. Cn5-15]
MKPLGNLKRHFWLVKRMAKTTGVDLAAARDGGQLSQKDWAQMVSRCRTCSTPEACSRWLDSAALNGGAEVQPEYCENKDRLNSLKSGTTAPCATD